MSEIKVEKISLEQIKELNIPNSLRSSGQWSVWECEPSVFDWQYSDTEVAYLFEGKVKVRTPSQEVEIEKGDLVTFPKGLKCTWEIKETIRKVYKFE